MMPCKPISLVRKLTGKMVIVQLLSLSLFFGVGVFPLVIYPIVTQAGSARAVDPSVSRTLASAFTGVEGDSITVTFNPEVSELIAAHPNMYVYALTEEGASATIGILPGPAQKIIANLSDVAVLDLRTRDENGRFVIRTEESPIGPVHVLIGNGPTVSVVGLLRNATIMLAVSIWLVLTAVSCVAIPLIVRRELRGVQHLADDASLINYENRGDRLRETGVPRELVPLVQAVNATLDRLDSSYADRQKFLAAAAHEVRTPIAILQIRLEQSAPFPEKNDLLFDVARLATLSEQLLEVQRLGLVRGEVAPVDLCDLAEQVVGELAPLAINSGYELAVDEPDEPVIVHGDARAIQHAVQNLVQNAIAHAGGQGEIVVRVGADHTVTVTDEGQGIPEDARERIFEPFERLHRSGRGSGLGLNLVYSIMQHHGGSVAVSESPKGGAQFVLKFPPSIEDASQAVA